MDLYIIGAGNVGGFLAYHVEQFGDFRLKGFLDDDIAKHNEVFYDLKVVGGLDCILYTKETLAVAIAIANPVVKQKIVSILKQNSLIHFPSFVHPQVWQGEKVAVEEGCIIYPGVSINYETQIKAFSTINMNAAIGHNCTLGEYTTLSPGVSLGGFTTIGERSFVGIGASTLQGTTIGKEVTVGGMTMVIKDIPDGATVVGNPARIIKQKEL